MVEDIAYRPNAYRIPEIYATAAGNRLEIRQANISVEQAMALVKSAKADILPSVALKAQGTRINDDWNPFDREAINEWSLSGVLTWTFDMFRNRETVKERRATQARAFVNRELLVEQIMEEVKTAYLDMKRSESDIADNKKAVEFRQENFRINQERYKEQVATYIEVLDAQRQLGSGPGRLFHFIGELPDQSSGVGTQDGHHTVIEGLSTAASAFFETVAGFPTVPKSFVSY